MALTIFSAASTMLSTPALSAPDAVVTRQYLMYTIAQAARFAERMTSGEIPYDAARAAAAMRSIHEVPARFVTLFPIIPENASVKKNGRAAQPMINRNMVDFLTRAQRLRRLSARAAAASDRGEAAFRQAFESLTKTCASCHRRYRHPLP